MDSLVFYFFTFLPFYLSKAFYFFTFLPFNYSWRAKRSMASCSYFVPGLP